MAAAEAQALVAAAQAGAGDVEGGLEGARASFLAAWRAGGAKVHGPRALAGMADALRRAGDPAGALPYALALVRACTPPSAAKRGQHGGLAAPGEQEARVVLARVLLDLGLTRRAMRACWYVI